MNVLEFVGLLNGVISKKKREKLERCESLKCVLKKLKKQRNNLRRKIEDEEDEERRKELKERLDVISKQREKGLQILREMKEDKE